MKTIKDYSFRLKSDLLLKVEARVLTEELLIVNFYTNANILLADHAQYKVYLVDKDSGMSVGAFNSVRAVNKRLDAHIERLHTYKKQNPEYYKKQVETYEKMKLDPSSYEPKYSVTCDEDDED